MFQTDDKKYSIFLIKKEDYYIPQVIKAIITYFPLTEIQAEQLYLISFMKGKVKLASFDDYETLNSVAIEFNKMGIETEII